MITVPATDRPSSTRIDAAPGERVHAIANSLCALLNRLRSTPPPPPGADAGYHPLARRTHQQWLTAQASGRLTAEQPAVLALAENLLDWMAVPFASRGLARAMTPSPHHQLPPLATLTRHVAQEWADIAAVAQGLAHGTAGRSGEALPTGSLASVWRMRPLMGYGFSTPNPVPVWLGDCLIGDTRALEALRIWFANHATKAQAAGFAEHLVTPWASWTTRVVGALLRQDYAWPGIAADAERLRAGSAWLLATAQEVDPLAQVA